MTSLRQSVGWLARGSLCGSIWCAVAALFRSRAALQAEILVPRHQLNALSCRSPKWVVVSNVPARSMILWDRAKVSWRIGAGNQDGVAAGQGSLRNLRRLITVLRRVLRDRSILARCPWQTGLAERLIGSIRGTALVAIFGEQHLRHLPSLTDNVTTKSVRLSLKKDAPVTRRSG
jgi:hypothetical protein